MIPAHAADARTICPITPQAVRVTSFDDRRPTTTALCVWPHPAAWAQGLAQDDRWFPVPFAPAGAALADPDEPHIDSRLLDGWDADVRTLLATLPDEVREAIRLLPRIYAWKVLVLIGHLPEALVLVQQHLVLAALVAFTAPVSFDPNDPYPEIERCLQGAPESLLGLLRLPEDPPLVSLLDDLQPEVLRELGDDGVMELLQERSRRWF